MKDNDENLDNYCFDDDNDFDFSDDDCFDDALEEFDHIAV